MKNEPTTTCEFAGWATNKYTPKKQMIITQTKPESNEYKSTLLDQEKKEADFLLIEIGAKPLIYWKNGSVERLKSRKALEKLQAKFKWKCDF